MIIRGDKTALRYRIVYDVLLFVASQMIKLLKEHGVALRRNKFEANSHSQCNLKVEDFDRAGQCIYRKQRTK